MKQCKIFLTLFIYMIFNSPGLFSATKEWGTLKIAVVLPATGSQSMYGKETKDGIKVALEQIRTSSQSTYERMKFFYIDTQSKTSTIQPRLSRLHQKVKINLILGGIHDYDGKKIAESARELNLPLILIGSKNKGAKEDILFFNQPVNLVNTEKWIEKIELEKKVAEEEMYRSSGKRIKSNVLSVGQLKSPNNIESVIKQIKMKWSHASFLNTENSGFDVALTKIIQENKSPLIINVFSPLKPATWQIISKTSKNKVVLSTEKAWLAINKEIKLRNDHNKIHVLNRFTLDDNRPELKKFFRHFHWVYKRDPSKLAALAYQSIFYVKEAFEKAKSNRLRPIKEALSNITFESLDLKIIVKGGLFLDTPVWWQVK